MGSDEQIACGGPGGQNGTWLKEKDHLAPRLNKPSRDSRFSLFVGGRLTTNFRGSFCHRISAVELSFNAPQGTPAKRRPIETTTWVPSAFPRLPGQCVAALCFPSHSLVTPFNSSSTHSLGHHQQQPHHIAIEARRQHSHSTISRYSVRLSRDFPHTRSINVTASLQTQGGLCIRSETQPAFPANTSLSSQTPWKTHRDTPWTLEHLQPSMYNPGSGC